MSEPFDLDEALAIVHAATGHTAKYVPGMRIGQVGRLRHVHYDLPRWWLTDYFQAFDVAPGEVVRTIQDFSPAPYLLGVITADPHVFLAPYAALGYKTVRAGFVEPVMAKRFTDTVRTEERYPVQRVETEEQRQFFNSVIPADDPHGQMQPEEIEDPQLNYYYVEQDGQCVCHGKAIQPFAAAVVVEPLGTQPEYRRRGIATALMHRLHADAVERGAVQCVIIASPKGKLLYDTLGYELLAYHQEFVPNHWKREDYP